VVAATFQGKTAVEAQLSAEVAQLRSALVAVKRWTHPVLDSPIVSDFPMIFVEFRGKAFELLWRGSRDGFGALAFRGRCDGHANTLTVILDTNGNVFGGFTSMEWESRVKNGKWNKDNRIKADGSEKSFLFMLQNPHNVAARIFALKGERKHRAL
jgi:hypothetical protein